MKWKSTAEDCLYTYLSHISGDLYTVRSCCAVAPYGVNLHPGEKTRHNPSLHTRLERERDRIFNTIFSFFFFFFHVHKSWKFFWKGNCVLLLLLLTYGMSGIGGRYITHPHASRASFVSRVHLHKTPRESIDSWCVSITLDTKAPKSSAVAPFAPTADILLCSIWCRFIYFFQDQIKRGSCRT